MQNTAAIFAGAIVMATLLVLLYIVATTRTTKKRFTEPWQYDVRPHIQRIPDAAFNRLRFVLITDETEVFLVTRRHWVYLVQQVVPPVLVAISLIIGYGYGLVIYPEAVVDIPPWSVLMGSLLLLVLAGYMSLDWIYSFVMITSKRLIILRIPPTVFPWMQAPISALPLKAIQLVENKDSFWGNMLGYGAVDTDTPVQQDEAFNRIRWLPHHEEIVRILYEKVEAYKQTRQLGCLLDDGRAASLGQTQILPRE